MPSTFSSSNFSSFKQYYQSDVLLVVIWCRGIEYPTSARALAIKTVADQRVAALLVYRAHASKPSTMIVAVTIRPARQQQSSKPFFFVTETNLGT